MDDAPSSQPPDADTPPAPATAAPRRALAWTTTLWTMVICTLLVLFITAALPWPTPRGMYSAIGLGMLLPFLLIGALIAVGVSATAVFVAAQLSGLRGWATTGCLALAAMLALIAFLAGFEMAGG
ncbi:hypothetical protein [Stenotrophomonas sp. 24(2023)]|uniref:hypothetical protein n=1 Tax=Stenotrophomonas sp. 24(2023) TaxID=3068324 RepID=UPI0027E12802|nr:hypothetical protein [Stenotrophomonas sp. 24(2023)]WMJ69246.1 hypothetical protein Q9R17_19050 [Stenotrophomonas sp. 24(2023)]